MRAAPLMVLAVLSCSPVHAATLEDAAALKGAPVELQAALLNRMFDNGRGGLLPAAGRTGPASPLTQAELRQMMLQNLDFVSMAFKSQYAPKVWKESHNGWDLDAEVRKAKEEIRSSPNLTLRDYQAILRRVVLSSRDYHVNIRFASTERSSLPFQVAASNGRYFLVRIDRSKLPEESFPFHEGDELVLFDGKKTDAVVKELQATAGGNVAGTDHALAALWLTVRGRGSIGSAPQGPVTLAIRPRGSEKLMTHQLIWDYNPEMIGDGMKPMKLMLAEAPRRSVLPLQWMDNMLAPVVAGSPESGNRFGLGNREGFLPPLGLKLWESDPSSTFQAYLYKANDGRLLGYLRVPSYTPADPDQAIADFAAIVSKFEETTDALVIDQLNNPGGSVFYLYALVSMLSDQAAVTPRHRIAITQADVVEAAQFLSAPPVTNDEGAKALLGPTVGGYPTSYTLYRHFLEFSRFIVDQWNQGKRLTDPTYLWGVDQINPSTQARYTKPILLLINELDFSGGDFFPTILQDNKRVTVFGARTAGAGGFIRQVQFPNQLGINFFTMTGSIAVRPNGNPIENLGVTPDVKYATTPADLQGGFAGYRAAVEKTLAGMLAKKAK